MMRVELIYIGLDQVTVQMNLELAAGSSVAEALKASNIHILHPETKDMPMGIYAKRVSLDYLLKEGDRIELYRPLLIDPKEKRRQKAGKR